MQRDAVSKLYDFLFCPQLVFQAYRVQLWETQKSFLLSLMTRFTLIWLITGFFGEMLKYCTIFARKYQNATIDFVG